jgi:bifunctional UDP-N-acetylglucosamine pyrophosphorylase/glucosamine-1-phosphate N-acetyltransferase
VTTAIILAQGTGSKIWPFGATRPKAAIPIGGAPLLRQQIESLEAAGITAIIVVAGSRFEAHLRYLASGKGSQPAGAAGLAWPRPARYSVPPLGGMHSAKIEVVAFDPVQGTAPALRRALELVEVDDVLVLYGDVLLDPATLPGLLAAHAQDRDTPVVLAAPLHPSENPTQYLAVRVRDSLVEEVIAHPRHSVTHRLAGAFVFPREMILPYLEAHPGYMAAVPSGGMPPQDEADLAQCLQMMVEDGLTLRALEPAALALDIDRPWDILIANHLWLDWVGQGQQKDVVHPTARVSESAEIRGHVVLNEDAVIGPGVFVEGNLWMDKGAVVTDGAIVGANTYIGPHTRVADYACVGDRTSLGPRCKIGHCAEVHGVMFGRSTVMHYCEIWGAFGEAVDIGAATVCGTLRFDDQPQTHQIRGRREHPRHASDSTFIGDFCRTGANSIFQPGSKVGAYSAVGPGVLVSGDVPERSLLLLKQQVERREWGPEKHGW